MELTTTTKSTPTTMMVMMAMAVMMMMFGTGGGSSPEPQCNLEPVVPPSEDLLLYSDVVVLGEVTKKSPEPAGVDPARKVQAGDGDEDVGEGEGEEEDEEDGDAGDAARPEMYRVSMLVYCVYKGQQVPRVIQIWEAGNITEDCPDQEMKVGHLYLAFLYKHSPTVHTPAFAHLPDTYKDELYVVCDLNITTPVGDLPEGSRDVTCADTQAEYDEDDDYYGEGQQPCIPLTAKPGDSKYRIKKPNNLFIAKTEKVEGDEGDGGDGGAGSISASACLTLLLSSALLVAATVVGPLL